MFWWVVWGYCGLAVYIDRTGVELYKRLLNILKVHSRPFFYRVARNLGPRVYLAGGVCTIVDGCTQVVYLIHLRI